MNSKFTPQDLAEGNFEDELKPGTELLHGQYVVEQFLNNGGFGITYLAKDSLLRLVVIKECFPETICRRVGSTVQVRSRDQVDAFRTIVDHFIEEARGLARLSHPHIVGVHQVFEDNDTAYMAMDFVEGRDLLEIAETGVSIAPKDLELITFKLLDAIGFIHQEGVLHRDISPDNILLNRANEPVLIDFGAARETVTRDKSYLADLRTVKDGYSPQEFYVKASEQHPSSDLYSLAASLYYVMSKELPASAQARMIAIAGGEPDPYVSIKHRVHGYSEPFLDAIDQALQLFPKDRIQSAAEWRARIVHTSAPQTVRGSVSRPVLAVDGDPASASPQSADMEPRSKRAVSSQKQISVRAARPSSELEPGQRDAVSSQAEVARALDPSRPSPVKTILLGGSAVVAVAAIGLGVTYMGQAPQSNPTVVQTAQVAPTPPVPATEEAAPQRVAGKPEQVPFFLADSSSGDVEVSSPSGSRLTAADTAPIAAGQRPGAVPDANTAAQPITGNGATSDLAASQTGADAPLNAALRPDQDLSLVLTGTAVPFDVVADPADPNLVATSESNLADQLRPGLRVVSVNGFPLDTLADVQRVVQATTDPELGEELPVTFGIENPETGETYLESITLPVHRQTMLLNGAIFVTRQEGENWQTVVTQGLGTGEADLQTGDQLVALMPENELIDGPDSLSRLLERGLEAGLGQFNFAVLRNGEMWLVSMSYAGRQR